MPCLCVVLVGSDLMHLLGWVSIHDTHHHMGVLEKKFCSWYFWCVDFWVVIYNIPTWLCQKRKYLLHTILISGPKQSGIDIDVFLEPLMKEMERLWRHGDPMYDTFRKEDFICRAIIFVTTNDYLALFALSR